MHIIEQYDIRKILRSITIVYGLVSYYIFRNYNVFLEGVLHLNNKFFDLLVVIVFVTVCTFEVKLKKIVKLTVLDWCFFLLMSVFFVIDAGFQQQNSIYFIKTEFVFVALSIISWTYIFSLLFLCFCQCKISEKRSTSQWKIMLIILCCWLPYLVIFYPGATSWDGMYQLNQFAGVQELTNIQPIEITCFMSFLIKIGSMIINPEFGLFLYCFLQTIFLAYVLSYGYCLVKRIGCTEKISRIVFAAMVLFPIPLFSTYVLLKDGFYASFCAWFCFILLHFYTDKESFVSNKINYVLWAISELGILFFRKNGIYVIILTTFVIIIKERKWKTILMISLLCMSVFKVSDYYFESHFGISGTNRAEVYSLPLQQTARYYTYYYDEITEEEKQGLKNVINIKAMVNRYNPALSDPIKGFFNAEASQAQVQFFFKTWLKNFFRHPMVYIEAFLGNANGYLDPTAPMLSERGFFYITPIKENDAYQFSFMAKSLEGIRKIYRDYIESGEEICIIGVLFQPGLYFWLMIFTTLSYVKEKKKLCKCLVPLYITFFICLVSPVNGAVRYILPLIETLPILLMLCVNEENKIQVCEYKMEYEENNNG